MKLRKIMLLAGVTLVSGAFLAACSSGNTANSTATYTYVYGTDPETLDYIATGRSSTSDITANLIDGLLEYDRYGNLVPSIATSWEVSEDGLTYTYKLREDAKWYTSDGEEYANVTAQDFVSGLKHAADEGASGLYVVEDSIKGLADYVNGVTTDFDTVGIKAVDDYTLEYTLNKAEPYWNSKTTMAVMMPVNQEFLTSKGSDFGKPQTDGILYNGPFLLEELTAKSTITYTKNQNYYDKDNVKVDQVKLNYIQGKSSDLDSLATNFENGVYTSAALYPNSSKFDAISEKFKDNIIYGAQGGSTYYYTFNVGRSSYNYTNKDDAQKESAKKAMLNKDFRQAITFAFNREAYSGQSNGQEGGQKNLRNTMVPPEFVSTSDGTEFGSLVTKLLVNYGSQWQDVDLSDAQNGLYNIDKAKEAFAKAKTTLEAEGVSFPIHLDVPVSETEVDDINQKSSMKESIETALGAENVVIDLHKLNVDDYDNITYFAETPEQKDWDLSSHGWGPDYQDPSTYLDIFNPESGAAVKNLGISEGGNTDIVTAVGLDKYNDLLKEANAVTTDTDSRYEKYAAAQAWLTDSALVIPVTSNGAGPGLSRVVPYTSAFAYGVGVKDEKTYKYMEVQSEAVTTQQYQEAREKWLKEREEMQGNN